MIPTPEPTMARPPPGGREHAGHDTPAPASAPVARPRLRQAARDPQFAPGITYGCVDWFDYAQHAPPVSRSPDK